jgi:thioredoxin reductase (NADPH)
MLTAEEIAGIELFAALNEAQAERLSRIAADIRLQPGEYAVHAGEERALFAVLEGHLETVNVVDGIETVVGGRGAGELIGEVPIALGTTFPFGFRASERTRVVRVSANDYYAIASVVPEVAVELGKLARLRIGGLQTITADQPPPRAIVLGDRLDARCTELRHFLDRNQVNFRWVVDDAPDAEEWWGGPLPVREERPILRLLDGQTVVRPSPREAAELLGLATSAQHEEYDVVIVGAGPAGLAAAAYGASEGLRTIVVERHAPGGQAGTSSRIENYLGFPSGVSGDELASRALQQVRRLGAELLVTRSVERLDPETRELQLDGGDILRTRSVILACGVAWRRLAIEGFDRLVGKGVWYGAARSEAPNAHGLDIHIVGAGNSAGQAALFFANHARSVTIICRGDSLRKSMSRYLIDQLLTRTNIGVLFDAEIEAVHGEVSLEAIEIREKAAGATTRSESGGLFIFIGADAETGWLPSEIGLDRFGYVLTGSDVRASGSWELERDPLLLETSVPGIFAAGDVRSGPVKRVAAAVGEGSMAISFVHEYLKQSAPALS